MKIESNPVEASRQEPKPREKFAQRLGNGIGFPLVMGDTETD